MGFALNIAFIPAIPIAIGIAILRYRLYDIDLIINRTLVYGSLTAMLVALYFVGIVVLQRVFVLLTSEPTPPLRVKLYVKPHEFVTSASLAISVRG
jgi:hypothetical protein